jgi:DNA topoisomerase-1
LRAQRHLRRIEKLAIPPAWTEVWICRVSKGHLQATGFDDRKRKQYLYHPEWRPIADSAKFIRIAEFGRLIAKLRKRVARDLGGRQLSRERLLAGMVAILDRTSIRVGNEEYVRANNSYGLTTLRTRHVLSRRGRIELRFRAKGGLQHKVMIEDRRIVKLMRQLKRLRGEHVFQYRDSDRAIRPVDSLQVNEYLRDASGQATITAKDFRTWKASSLAAALLYEQRGAMNLRARKRLIRQVIAQVAETLGNTPAVCRKSYIHPGLLTSFESGEFDELFKGFSVNRKRLVHRNEQIFARFCRRWS